MQCRSDLGRSRTLSRLSHALVIVSPIAVRAGGGESSRSSLHVSSSSAPRSDKPSLDRSADALPLLPLGGGVHGERGGSLRRRPRREGGYGEAGSHGEEAGEAGGRRSCGEGGGLHPTAALLLSSSCRRELEGRIRRRREEKEVLTRCRLCIERRLGPTDMWVPLFFI